MYIRTYMLSLESQSFNHINFQKQGNCVSCHLISSKQLGLSYFQFSYFVFLKYSVYKNNDN